MRSETITSISVIALILLCIYSTYGQIDSTKRNKKSAWLIKWAPSSLMTPETPTMQLGMEFIPMSNHFSFSGDYGVKCIIGKNEWDNRFERQYTKSRVELRYYLYPFKEEREVNYFLSVEGFRIDYRYSTQNSSYCAYDGHEYSYDFAHTTKNIEGIVVKSGVVLKFKFPFTLEAFVGPGYRDVNVTYFDVVNKQNTSGPGLFGWLPELFSGDAHYERHSLKLHLAAGCKISYQLHKKNK